ncbi:hypothetical protein CA13_33210 [Planctomycetes bacterium CA13]|uniref:Transcobalamin-like C-terminal domain-containing protein n=1 Tax=Novipirellula herctigrandis TaxID=2527986 RepID=A0A5C5Z4D5_9BACT|nr:hypothetical protein CA13_33210 [Planctomycetes bacterium CA13]
MNKTHFIVLLSVSFLIAGCNRATVEPSAEEITTEAGTVTVVIQSSEGERQTEVDNVLPGATVESVMRSIEEVPITINGSGVTAFVSKMDGVETESTKGWTYMVNDEYVNKGIGSVMLVPPATVTWTYGTYEQTIGNKVDTSNDESATTQASQE